MRPRSIVVGILLAVHFLLASPASAHHVPCVWVNRGPGPEPVPEIDVEVCPPPHP